MKKHISIIILFTLLSSVLWAAITDNIVAFWAFGDAVTAPVLSDSTGRGNNLTPNLRIADTTCKFTFGWTSLHLAIPGVQVCYSSMKGWGKWNRVLTSGEKIALANKEYWPFTTTTTLQDCTAYYLLNEVGGSSTYADATGRGNTLTASGTTERVAGPNGTDYGTKLYDGPYLYKDSPGTDLKSNQYTCTIAGWAQVLAKPAGGMAQQCYWTQIWGITEVECGFTVYYDPTADRFCVDFDAGSNQDLSKGTFNVESNLSPTIGTWYFIIAELDLVNNTTSISVNNGTPTVFYHRLQPEKVAGVTGYASQFYSNAAGSFATRTSGFDAGSYPVVGNSFASKAQNSDLSIGNNSKTVWGWFKTTNVAYLQTLAGFYGGTGSTTDWFLIYSPSLLYFYFGLQMANVSVSLSDTNWHFVVAWFDKNANTININLDNGTTVSTAGPTTPQTVSNSFIVGSDGLNHQFQGVLQAWGIADGVPTTGDIAALYNGGIPWIYGASLPPPTSTNITLKGGTIH